MSIPVLPGQKTKYRITLSVDVMEDFSPMDIDWEKVLQLEPNESVSAYVEDLSPQLEW